MQETDYEITVSWRYETWRVWPNDSDEADEVAEEELSLNVSAINDTLVACVNESPIDVKKLGQKR